MQVSSVTRDGTLVCSGTMVRDAVLPSSPTRRMGLPLGGRVERADRRVISDVLALIAPHGLGIALPARGRFADPPKGCCYTSVTLLILGDASDALGLATER